jgi:hypothetical protein
MTAHNQWLSTTRSIPHWTTSGFSLNSEARITTHTLNFWMNYDSCITSKRPEYRSPARAVNCPSVCCRGNLCLVTCYLATTCSLPFVAAGTWFPSRFSAMDVRCSSTIPAFRRWLASRYLGMDYSFTISFSTYPVFSGWSHNASNGAGIIIDGSLRLFCQRE